MRCALLHVMSMTRAGSVSPELAPGRPFLQCVFPTRCVFSICACGLFFNT